MIVAASTAIVKGQLLAKRRRRVALALGYPRRVLEPDPYDDAQVSFDRLAGDWSIYQLRRGHRFSADDMFTAWLAANEAPTATSLCDIGAGIGSVGLMTLWRMGSEARLLAVEAQEVSHQLMRRTVEANGLASRVSMRVGDLRDESVLPERGVFELVTGSPPYIPLGKGVVSPVAQRAACRMELRGSIADYAVTAARILKPKGSFVVCFTASDPRGPEAIKAAGLHVRVRQDVVFRGGQAPLIAIFAAQHEPCALDHRSDFSIRGPDGEWTEAYFQLREQMGTVLERKPEVRTPPRARGGAR